MWKPWQKKEKIRHPTPQKNPKPRTHTNPHPTSLALIIAARVGNRAACAAVLCLPRPLQARAPACPGGGRGMGGCPGGGPRRSAGRGHSFVPLPCGTHGCGHIAPGFWRRFSPPLLKGRELRQSRCAFFHNSCLPQWFLGENRDYFLPFPSLKR